MHGLFIDTRDKGYVPDLDDAFSVLGDIAQKYNWLLTDYDCNIYPSDKMIMNGEFAWFSGGELVSILNEHQIQFIWCVATAYPKDIALDEILQYPLPYANDNPAYSQTTVTMQNPLSDIEIVPFDSSFLFVISKSEEIIQKFVKKYPDSIDLAEHNLRI